MSTNSPNKSGRKKTEKKETADRLIGYNVLVQKNSSTGCMSSSPTYPINTKLQGGSGDKILVSNAQSRDMTESLVSAVSSRNAFLTAQRSKMLDYSEVSPTRISSLPKPSENRFLNQMKEM